MSNSLEQLLLYLPWCWSGYWYWSSGCGVCIVHWIDKMMYSDFHTQMQKESLHLHGTHLLVGRKINLYAGIKTRVSAVGILIEKGPSVILKQEQREQGMLPDVWIRPSVRTFGAQSGKLLGFIVSSKRGIEVDPDKVKAIQEMPIPRTETERRGFLGRINYIARFISNLTATCKPIFKLLKKNHTMTTAFDRIKEYLKSPPVLVPPTPGHPLIMYLTVLETSMGCILGQQNPNGKRTGHYYLSRKFTDYETRYSALEQRCCALAWAAHKLRLYYICFTIN